jgi:hypothetical protein
MKRYWHASEYIRKSRRLAKKHHQRKLLTKEKQTATRRSAQGMSRSELRMRNEFKHLPIAARFPRAPQHMCFLRNPDEMATFIGELKNCAEKRMPVYVDISHVQEIDLNAVTALLAVMVQFKSRGIKFNGNMPQNHSAKKLLIDSGFFEHLSGKYLHTDSYDFYGSSVYTHGKLCVDSEFSQSLIEKAATTVWGERFRCPGVQRTFIELMQNTNNHASLKRKGEKHWWISVQHLPQERRVLFSFVDFGIGVFESLANKPKESTFYNIIERLKRLFHVETNAQILKLVFEGELHKTVTGQYYRGKGLPGIYSVLKKNQLAKLSMITNDVYFCSERGEFRRLKHGFSGTFVSWELTELSEHLPYEN